MAEKKIGSVKKSSTRTSGSTRIAAKRGKNTGTRMTGIRTGEKHPRLLSGGNPQIAKADGAGPVRAYIEAMPGWKRDIGRRLDVMIVDLVPGVKRAVRWNSPFYGVEQPDGSVGWFMSLHCITRYVKVAFFDGTSLKPMPPEESKNAGIRYVHIFEDGMDEATMRTWINQASRLPGLDLF